MSKSLPTPAHIVYLTRRETFCASHRLSSKELSPEANGSIYGKCARENGHGHNYVLEVTLRGPVNPKTGLLINMKHVSEVMHELILNECDHTYLNLDHPTFKDVIPTGENMALVFWDILKPAFGDLLFEVRLHETEKNQTFCRGETV